jgi:hypothetical protein
MMDVDYFRPSRKATMEKQSLSHLDSAGNARMVDVSGKSPTARLATAVGYIEMRPDTLRAIAQGQVPKGEVLGVARVAGIMAAKQTGDLTPERSQVPDFPPRFSSRRISEITIPRSIALHMS